MSPCKSIMNNFVLVFSFLNPKASLAFRHGDSVPTHQVHLLLVRGGAPNEISLNFINVFGNFNWKEIILHGMIWNAV